MPIMVRVVAGVSSAALIGWGLATIDDVSDGKWLSILGVAWLLLLMATYVPLPGLAQFSRSVVRVGMVFATVLAIVSVQLIRIQVIQQDSIVYRTAQTADGDALANPRVVLTPLENERGEIVDRDGTIIAATTQEGDHYVRSWPNPATAYVAGYHSPLLFGSSGLELSYSDVLTGQAGNNPFLRMINNLLHKPQEGSSLQLTLDTDLQESAQDMLGDKTGAIVVVDVETGNVLVLASNPTYDPNQLFTSAPSDSEKAQEYWDTLANDPADPLVTRATLGLYTPGSTFKTVTAAIAIELGIAEPDSVYSDTGELVIDGRVLEGNNRPDESVTKWTLREGLMWSLNIVLAQVGMQIGPEDFWRMAERFGFGDDLPFDLPVARSQLAANEEFLESDNAIADTGFGQGQIQVSPLQMALVAASYGNDGHIMQPRLVDKIVAANGDVIETMPVSTWKSPVSPETAAGIESIMIDTVTEGSAQAAQVPGYVVGGKTGTAETNSETPNSWFIGFIGTEEGGPKYAVAVVLEHGETGAEGPVPIGRDILLHAMNDPSPEDG